MAKTATERQREFRAKHNASGKKNQWYRRSGYVYLIRAAGTDYYKIGISRTCVTMRAKELQTGCPHDLYVMFYAPVMNAEETEAVIHEWIKYLLKRGEWFTLDVSQVDRIRNLLVIESNYYESKLVWLASHGAVDIQDMVRAEYKEYDPYAIQTA